MHERSRGFRVTRAGWLLAGLAAPWITSAGPPALGTNAELEMQGLFETVTPLLPLAMDEAAWSARARRDSIEEGLDNLAEAGAALGRHAATRDAGFQTLSESLAEDIARTRDHYAEGQFEEARVSMVEITNTCAACHTRLPASPDDSRPALPAPLFAGLSLHEQSQVWVATRRFDRALAVWEAAFADEMQAPGRLDMEGYLLDYMTIGLRVRQDPVRVRKTFARFAQRPDMPIYLGRHLARWEIALAAIEDGLETSDPLAQGRALVGGQGVPRPELLGREQTVYDLAASSLLLRFIDRNAGSPEELAEAYYLLGVVEARSVDSYWLPQAEHHLEAAIRLAPGSAPAASAYALLEEYVVVGFGGANGDALPNAAFEKLRQLSQLIEASAATPPDDDLAAP